MLLIALAVWSATHLRNEPAPPAIARFEIQIPDKMKTVAANLLADLAYAWVDPRVSIAGQA